MDTEIKMTPEIALAIEAGIKDGLKNALKLKKDEDLRDKVASEQAFQNVRLTLSLEIGKLTFGTDTEKAPTASIPMIPAMALLVKRMGFQRDEALKTLKEVMLEALALDSDAASKLAEEEGVKEAEDLIKQQVIASLPKSRVRKSIKASGSVLTVTDVDLKASPAQN